MISFYCDLRTYSSTTTDSISILQSTVFNLSIIPVFVLHVRLLSDQVCFCVFFVWSFFKLCVCLFAYVNCMYIVLLFVCLFDILHVPVCQH